MGLFCWLILLGGFSDDKNEGGEEMSEAENKESEFGKGFIYCIGLFLCHAERHTDMSYPLVSNVYIAYWFSGAADHLFELEIPEHISLDLKVKIQFWRNRCLNKRLEKNTLDEIHAAIEEAKDILRLYDIECGIDAIKGIWQ